MTDDEWYRVRARLVEDRDGCWLWPGATGGSSRRYGVALLTGSDGVKKLRLVHRSVYEHCVGPLPTGAKEVIEHTCMKSLCARPDHLRRTSQRENLLRGRTVNAINAGKTECKRGHLFDEENTYVCANGARSCRTCKRDWMRRHRNLLSDSTVA